MPAATNKTDDPCEECRNRHLKCDNCRPACSQCLRTGHACYRTKGQPKFRDGSSMQYEKRFSKDQAWVSFSKNAKIQFVDQTAELENFYATDSPEPAPASSTPALPTLPRRHGSNGIPTRTTTPLTRPDTTVPSPGQHNAARSEVTSRTPTDLSPVSFDNILSFPPPKRRKTNESGTPTDSHHTVHLPPAQSSPASLDIQQPFPFHNSPSSVPFQSQQLTNNYVSPREANETRRIEQEYARISDNQAAQIPDEPFLSVSNWKKHFRWPNQYTTQQCRCLFRYYIDILGHWFDVGDPTRRFTTVVPQRAKRSPPLLNAIFSAAALHLRHSSRLRRPGRTIEYAGYELRDLNEVSTIKYYLATNAYLRVLCTNEAHTRDEDLLAATVIIRFYEELAALISGEPRDQLTRPFQLFVAAQARPDNFYFPPEQYNFQIPGVFASIRTIIEPYLETYQHGSFRVALRQECQRALLSRGKVHLPLEAWSFLEGFDETEDSVWTDRHLYHYARVLQYCFSHDEPESQKLSQYEALKGFETKWEETRPLSFSPYDQAQPDRDNGEIFPKYWYVNEVHAVGVMYLHLSRLLLTVYNPYIHRIGPGSAAAQRRVSAEVREVVIQICGVAMSSLNTQPVLVQAMNTISMFGEHFTDRREQEALLEVLEELESRHGWPVHRDAEALKREWGWTLDKDS